MKLLMKMLSEAVRKKTLEKIGDIIQKRKRLLYDENDNQNLNNLVCQVLVVKVAEVHDKACKPRGKIKPIQIIFGMSDLQMLIGLRKNSNNK